LLWIAIPFTLFPLAEQHIASGVTGLINGALPIFAVACGSIMLRRAPGRMQALGLAVGFLGILAIALPSFSEGSSEAIGVLMALLAVVCYGIAVNIVAPLTQRYGSLPVMARGRARRHLDDAVRDRGASRSPRSRGRRSWPWWCWESWERGSRYLMGQLIARVGARATFAIYLTPVVALDPGRGVP
jgi:hypothetical protein